MSLIIYQILIVLRLSKISKLVTFQDIWQDGEYMIITTPLSHLINLLKKQKWIDKQIINNVIDEKINKKSLGDFKKKIIGNC